nr:reverse transcriptase domain-containing protein [Tanacetum cinerariifolium]
MALTRLQELVAAQNSNSLTDAVSVYIEMKMNEDLHFAAGLSHLWEVLYSMFNEHRLLIAKLNVFGGKLFEWRGALFLVCLVDFGTREFTIYEMTIGCSVWMVRYCVHTNEFMTPLLEDLDPGSLEDFLVPNYNQSYKYPQSLTLRACLGFGSKEPVLVVCYKWIVFGKFSKWSEESEIAEEEVLLKFLRNRYDGLRRKNARRRVLIREMEALGERGVAVDSLKSLKQTHARETTKLAALPGAIVESLAGIHEKECHCMRTRSSSSLIVESFTIPKRRNRRRSKLVVESELRTIVETLVATMADTRTMSKLLQAPIEGYGDAIIIPDILVENFELNFGLLTLVTSSQFRSFERDDPHSHIRWFNKITSTLKPQISRTTSRIFNRAADGNLLNRTPRDALTIIENKSKVRTSRNKPVVSKASAATSSSTPAYLPKITALTDVVKAILLQNKTPSLAPVKAIEEICVTCGGPHPYYECHATDGNIFNAYAATGTYNQGELEREPEATKDRVQTTSSGSTTHVQPPKLSLPELTPTRMTLELANRTVAYPVGVAKYVFEKVGKFPFLADFIVVDYNVDPRVPLIFERPFLRMKRALIYVHGEELTLRFNDESITFNFGHTSRYSYRYDYESVNRIDVIDVTCEEYAQEGGDFILEEIEACLTRDSIPPGIDDADFNSEGDILLLNKLLNDDPSSPLLPKELNFEELKIIKSSVDDPPELELKDLPSHLEYAFFEETNKLPVIIAKKLKDEEKDRLLKVLKSYKRSIAWKISDIKGIDPQFCTHKILMKDDFKPAVQH